MDTERTLSASFLLRLWQVETNGDLVWRASLESSQTGERWGFADVETLFDFLNRRTAPVDSLVGGPAINPEHRQRNL